LPWQPILEAKLAKLTDLSSFIALTFQNGLEYRNAADERIISGDD